MAIYCIALRNKWSNYACAYMGGIYEILYSETIGATGLLLYCKINMKILLSEIITLEVRSSDSVDRLLYC